MKSLILIISLNLFLPLFLLVILPSVFIRVRQGTSQLSSDRSVSLIKNQPLTFTFSSDQSNLQSISINMKNPGIKNTSTIIFSIKSSNSQKTINFNGANIGDPSIVPLKFDAFSDPPNTQYSVTLSTDNISHDGLYVLTDTHQTPAFSSYYQQSNIISNISYNFNHQLNLFASRSRYHSIIYLSLILMLNLLIILPK